MRYVRIETEKDEEESFSRYTERRSGIAYKIKSRRSVLVEYFVDYVFRETNEYIYDLLKTVNQSYVDVYYFGSELSTYNDKYNDRNVSVDVAVFDVWSIHSKLFNVVKIRELFGHKTRSYYVKSAQFILLR